MAACNDLVVSFMPACATLQKNNKRHPRHTLAVVVRRSTCRFAPAAHPAAHPATLAPPTTRPIQVIVELIAACLSPDARQRPSAEKALQVLLLTDGW